MKRFHPAGMLRGTLVVLAVAALAVAVPASGRTSRATAPSLRHDARALVAAGAPGVILLVRDGARTTRIAAGLADVARHRPMDARDHYRIASLTKTYTATVVLQLVAERKLALSDSVARWLPGVVPNGRHITIRHLLSHTSGIFDFEADPRVLAPYLAGDLGHYWSPRQLVRFAVSHPPLFPPGAKRYSYSNTNYVIAGLIVKAATHKSIGTQLKRRIFQPLHLTGTSFPNTVKMPRPYAHGYLVAGRPPAIDTTGLSPSLSPASGAIISTADDIAHFYRALLTGRLVKPRLLKAMKTTRPASSPVDIPGQRYGLGLMRFPTPCGIAWGHNGVLPGYFSMAISSADGRRQAVLMVNHDAASIPKAAGARIYPLALKAFCRTR